MYHIQTTILQFILFLFYIRNQNPYAGKNHAERACRCQKLEYGIPTDAVCQSTQTIRTDSTAYIAKTVKNACNQTRIELLFIIKRKHTGNGIVDSRRHQRNKRQTYQHYSRAGIYSRYYYRYQHGNYGSRKSAQINYIFDFFIHRHGESRSE